MNSSGILPWYALGLKHTEIKYSETNTQNRTTGKKDRSWTLAHTPKVYQSTKSAVFITQRTVNLTSTYDIIYTEVSCRLADNATSLA